jgi:hypothetical protein
MDQLRDWRLEKDVYRDTGELDFIRIGESQMAKRQTVVEQFLYSRLTSPISLDS